MSPSGSSCRLSILVLGAILGAVSAVPLRGQTGENVLLVVNEASPVSIEIGQYYAQKRRVPAENVLRLRTALSESISRQDYERQIEGPLAGWFHKFSAHDRILYIVMTKGMPLRVEGSAGLDGTAAAVDSELTLLYRKMAGESASPAGRVPNPYFVGEGPVRQARAFSHAATDIFLVSRLDGFTAADVRGLIDRGAAPAVHGRILLDARDSSGERENAWLRAAAERLREMGVEDRVVLENTRKALSGVSGLLGYASWGSRDPEIRSRDLGLGFVPGALASTFVGADARTFEEPPRSWNIGTREDPGTHFAGSPHSLAGDLVRAGVTGIAGHVAEPLQDAGIRPDILFPAYLAGFNLVESYYLAIPFLSWQTIVVGDPLCAPFRSRELTQLEIDKGIDWETEQPGYFSARRIRNVAVPAFQRQGIHPDTTKILFRAEVRLAKQDFTGARLALEDATARDERIAAAHLMLAAIYEQEGEHNRVIDRYERFLKRVPDNPVVLNNLAYALAVRRNQPAEALPHAEKAYTLSKGNPNVTDTLGWIHHLLGDNGKALAYLEEAVQGAPALPEIRLHLAIVCEALGRREQAAVALAKALELSPQMEQREEVRMLRSRLKP